MSWDSYIDWSRLKQLIELVSLDGMLNEVLIEPDRTNADDWYEIIIDDQYETGFFRTLEYVLNRVNLTTRFNLLAVTIEPTENCKNIILDEFDFIGYDPLDRDYSISALVNCGGFDETFLPTNLNKFGLIDDYDYAYDVKKRLFENNPGEHHADTKVIAVWRHNRIGRRSSNT